MEAIKISKNAYKEWRDNGKPGGDHQLTIKKDSANKHVKFLQKHLLINNEEKLYTRIMESYKDDNKLFHKLINRQTKSDNNIKALRIDGKISYDQDKQRNSWADYYEKLATPKDINTDAVPVNLLRQYFLDEVFNTQIHVTGDMVKSAVKKMKKNKSADSLGYQAEHFLNLSDYAYNILGRIFSKDVKTPLFMHTGFKTPVPKKNRDVMEKKNHRGIIIVMIIGKIWEHIIITNAESLIDEKTNGMQFGFTKGSSPDMATLCITESIAHAKYNKLPLYIATIDGKTAFDIVQHNQMKLKLFYHGITGSLWIALDDIYSNQSETTRWGGQESRSYLILQGVGQGRIPSSHMYKIHINPLLDMLKNSKIGLEIGGIYIGAPTVADDLTLIATSDTQLTQMLALTYDFTDENNGEINTDKSSATEMVNDPLNNNSLYNIRNRTIYTSNSFKHMGLNWKRENTRPNIQDNIRSAYATSYLLMARKVHGDNGLSPIVSLHILKTYVYQRLLHGLKATVLHKSDIVALDKCHIKMLRCIQGLPDRTAKACVYLLLDEIPISIILHIRIMCLFHSICTLPDKSPLKQLLYRQMSLPDESGSWFAMVRKIAIRYNIDLILETQYPRSKLSWKKHIKNTIVQDHKFKLLEEAHSKSSLKNIYLEDLIWGSHTIWSRIPTSKHIREATQIRAKMLSGAYILEQNRFKFGISDSDICKCCCSDVENMSNFLLECEAHNHVRSVYMQRLTDESHNLNTANNTSKCKIILNGYESLNSISFNLQKNCSLYCLALHKSRNNILKINDNDYVNPDDITIVDKHMIPHINCENMSEWNCIACKMTVSEHDNAISCDICEEYQHITCHNIMGLNEYIELADSQESFQWICTPCQGI